MNLRDVIKKALKSRMGTNVLKVDGTYELMTWAKAWVVTRTLQKRMVSSIFIDTRGKWKSSIDKQVFINVLVGFVVQLFLK